MLRKAQFAKIKCMNIRYLKISKSLMRGTPGLHGGKSPRSVNKNGLICSLNHEKQGAVHKNSSKCIWICRRTCTDCFSLGKQQPVTKVYFLNQSEVFSGICTLEKSANLASFVFVGLYLCYLE